MIPFPDKKYKIIYADPPWDYSDVHTWKKMGGGVKGKYNTLNVWQICALPVREIADQNSILFLSIKRGSKTSRMTP